MGQSPRRDREADADGSRSASHDLSGTRLASAVVRAGVACVFTFLTYVGLVTLVAGRAGRLVAAVAASLLTALAAETVARGLA